jgi:hypothetical protein
MSKLIVIGDSFVTPLTYSKNYNINTDYWVNVLIQYEMFKEKELYVDGRGGRDIQTIIDNWIKVLPILNEEDFLIVAIPFFKRTRIPVNKYDISLNKIGIVNRFIGTSSWMKHESLPEFMDCELTVDNLIKKMETQELINSSVQSEENYIEIISSLKKITKSNIYIFSWADINYDNDAIEDKKILESKIGKFETLTDLWIKTNGKFGVEKDSHWSYDYNVKFAKYLNEKFSKNFSKKLI